MKSFKKAFLFGLIVWAVPFIAAMLIFPIRQSDRILFESIMPIVLAFISVTMAYLYFNHVELFFIKEGIYLGIFWFCLCIVLDQCFFSWGPMKMAFIDYIKDIGLTYLMIPIITIGIGYAENARFKKLA